MARVVRSTGMPGNRVRESLGAIRRAGTTVLRSPQTAHMRIVQDLNKFGQYRIKRR